MKEQKESERSTSYLEVVVATMVHLVALGLPAFIIWTAQPGSSKFGFTVQGLSVSFEIVVHSHPDTDSCL